VPVTSPIPHRNIPVANAEAKPNLTSSSSYTLTNQTTELEATHKDETMPSHDSLIAHDEATEIIDIIDGSELDVCAASYA
jgi:hypothetical protein